MIISSPIKPLKPHLSPLSRCSLAEGATARLRRAIVANEISPGAPLPENGLAAQLGVSRVPIREALIELEQEGLIEFDHRGRSRVRNFAEGDFEALFSMRSTLEVMAARLLVHQITDEDIKDLEVMIHDQETAEDLTELSLLDVAFHDRIIQIARHRPLAACWKTIRSQIEVWLARAHRAQAQRHLSSINLTVPGHRHLLADLCSRNEQKAESAMRMEMATWREWLPE